MLDEDGAVRESDNKKEFARRLDFGPWLLAWDRYALGAFVSRAHVGDAYNVAMLASRSGVGPDVLQVSNEAQGDCCQSCYWGSCQGQVTFAWRAL
jgi:hypothetical protein